MEIFQSLLKIANCCLALCRFCRNIRYLSGLADLTCNTCIHTLYVLKNLFGHGFNENCSIFTSTPQGDLYTRVAFPARRAATLSTPLGDLCIRVAFPARRAATLSTAVAEATLPCQLPGLVRYSNGNPDNAYGDMYRPTSEHASSI